MIRNTNDFVLPDSRHVLVDKHNDEWVLTYCCIDGDTTIRIRIQHSSVMDPDDIFCEVFDANQLNFRELAHFSWAPVELDPDWADVVDSSREDWPVEHRDEFLKLARIWTVCTQMAEWRFAMGDRPMVVVPRGHDV
jgi:hypothetical protein